MTDILASFPEGLGWGVLAVLLVRALVQQLPRIVDSIASAMREKATAARLTAQAGLVEQEAHRDDAAERRDLTGQLRALEQRVEEQERACAEEIRSAHELHAVTRDKCDALEVKHQQCDRRLAALSAELTSIRAEIHSGHTRNP
jgi:cell division septum initiation protein DivIVA